MTLTTHGILGAATASLFPSHYPIAWFAAFLSHFFSDAIPHWDYRTNSLKKDLNPLKTDFIISKKSLVDFIKIGFDFSLGIGLGFLFFPTPLYDPWIIIGGAFFGILPDPLQFVYWKTRREPFTSLQKFHVGIHAKQRIKNWRIGFPIQVLIVGVAVMLAFQAYSLLQRVPITIPMENFLPFW